MRIGLTIQVAGKAVPAGKKPESRLQTKYEPYVQTIVSVVTLSSPSKEMTENAARWSANNGVLARKALTMGFEDLAALTPRALELNAAEVQAMNGRDKPFSTVGGYSGRIQEQTSQDVLLFNGGLVHGQTLAD